jgi:hypothetical protein
MGASATHLRKRDLSVSWNATAHSPVGAVIIRWTCSLFDE